MRRGSVNIKVEVDMLFEPRTEREKVLAKFPQLYYTTGAANMLLKRELRESHKSWKPKQKVIVHGHYLTNGLDVIPR